MDWDNLGVAVETRTSQSCNIHVATHGICTFDFSPPGRYLLKVPGEHPLPPDYEDVLASNLAFRLLFDEATEKDSEDNADT